MDGARFEPKLRLGAGGMGEVWLARMRRPDGPEGWVALKRIRAERRDDEEQLALFEREARICSALSHPNIVGVHAWGVDAEGPYLALEYVPGCSASRLMRALEREDRLLPLSAGLAIARDLAAALACAHRAGPDRGSVVHRDVSPDNVLLREDGVAKLGDFGIAKIRGRNTLTAGAGTLKGKLAFVAPEMLDGADADPLTDLFAFGVTLYELLCGVPPFFGKTEAEVVRAVLAGTPASPRTLRPELSPALERLLLRCIARPRAQRPESMAKVVEALNDPRLPALEQGREALRLALRETLGEPAAEAPDPPGPPQTLLVPLPTAAPTRARGRRVALAAALLVLALGLGLASVAQRLLAARGVAGDPEPARTAAALRDVARRGTPAAPAEAAANSPEPPRTPVALGDVPRRATTAPAALKAAANSPEPARTPVAPGDVPPRGTPAAPADATNSPEPARTPLSLGEVPRRAATPAAALGAATNSSAPAPVAPARSRASSVPKPKSTASGRGRLEVRVSPWGHVFIDGALAGTSPLAPLVLPSGRHTVLVVNPELRAESRQEVEVRTGAVHTVRVDLRASSAHQKKSTPPASASPAAEP